MVSRRRFLAALTVSLTGLAGCQTQGDRTSQPAPTTSPTAGATPDSGTETPGQSTTEPQTDPRFGDRFDTVYDVVEAGADPNGTEPVDPTLERLVGDDTLLRFPPGTYRLHELSVEDVSNFAMVGDDATLKLATKGRAIFLGFERVSDILVEGFAIDNTDTNVAAWCNLKCIGGTNVVRDYTVDGFVDVNERTNGFTLMVEGADTSLELDGVDISNGGINGAAAFVFPRVEFYDPDRKPGSLTFRDCTMKGWGKEGLYASAHSGPLAVIGGEYANNAIAQVRIGGGNAPERAVIRDVTVTVNSIPDYMPHYNRILRGIWLKEGDEALIENCDVTLANLGVDDTQAAIIVNDQFGRATIRDCTVSTEGVRRPAILAERPASEFRQNQMRALDHLPPAWDVTVENVTIEGNSPNSESIRIEGRSGCTLADVTVNTSGQASDGLTLRNVDECTLTGGSITTDRFPVRMYTTGESGCDLGLSGVSLTGRDLQHVGSEISGGDSGQYCLGSGVLPDSEQPESDWLSLTKTEAVTNSGTETTASDSYRLYGRWLTQ